MSESDSGNTTAASSSQAPNQGQQTTQTSPPPTDPSGQQSSQTGEPAGLTLQLSPEAEMLLSENRELKKKLKVYEDKQRVSLLTQLGDKKLAKKYEKCSIEELERLVELKKELDKSRSPYLQDKVATGDQAPVKVPVGFKPDGTPIYPK